MSYLKRLSDTYENIIQTDFVKNKNVTEASIAEFKKFCDLCLPMNEDEKLFAQFISGSFRRSKSSFLKTLPFKNNKNNKTQHAINHRAVIMLTTPQLIVEEFNVETLIYMKYNSHTNEYLFSTPHIYPGLVEQQEPKESKPETDTKTIDEKIIRFPKSQKPKTPQNTKKPYNNKHYENRYTKETEPKTSHRLAKRLDEFIISDIVSPTETVKKIESKELKSWAEQTD